MSEEWRARLSKQLLEKLGEAQGKQLATKYAKALPSGYCEQYTVSEAIKDIEELEKLSEKRSLFIDFYQLPRSENPLHIKFYRLGTPVHLSDVLPMIDNMGLKTLRENPFKIVINKTKFFWLSDFTLTYSQAENLNMKKVKALFNEAFLKVCLGECENDGFNRLVLSAGLSWREITILRTYAKYMHQLGIRFSQSYIEQTLAHHPALAKHLVELFYLKFGLQQTGATQKKMAALDESIHQEIDKISSLDEDRIVRYIWSLIKASLRTNYFQTDHNGQAKDYLSIKFETALIPDLPPGQPMLEIFVYSPRFEGIHLRSDKVARGGLRWSDRPEDFRTEVLGLMKAQKVKNAVIVPSGAKGGFVLKKAAELTTREALLQEVVLCYQSFIRGLLDITDNLKDNRVVPPKQTIRYDDPDPYLVVAADKGTATFSDIANGIAKDYGFWMGDAFASGGSQGYDHKKMGITARGAWESIKRHFLEMNLDIHQQDFTVVGIGDMSGDVFGNGMLYSKHIRLLAAFDHRHIFLDPNPDTKKSYKERLRLFNLPTSSWEDYNPKLISKGGGVYSRRSKSIKITKEVKKALDISADALTPNELIRAILKAPVDLLFNGGIGTYVKASTESHADVGDKTNEFTRINGNELRCKMIGEGGNLGCTQLGRVEFALQGGLVNTDSIDNSAGVSCSDHEVNIKILLNRELQNGNLSEKQRNQLLTKMTDDVAELVLKDNYDQALVISFSAARTSHYSALYQAFIEEMERTVNLDRAVEFLPDNKKLLERKTAGQGLTRPELSIIMAYTKIYLTSELLKSDLPEDPYFNKILATGFPLLLSERYPKAMQEHRLRREIIATQLSNQIVNALGITFMYRMQIETGESIADIARAYTLASQAFQTDELYDLIDSLNYKVPVETQYELFHYVRQLLNLATRWFLHGKRYKGDLNKSIEHYKKDIAKLEGFVANLMVGETKTYLNTLLEQFSALGLAQTFIKRIASIRAIYTVLNPIEVATENKCDLIKTTEVYFKVGEQFNLVWFRDNIASDIREGHWDAMARLTLRDELDQLQRRLTLVILNSNKKEKNSKKLIADWLAENPQIQKRWEKLLEMLFESPNVDYTMFFIALKELSNLLD